MSLAHDQESFERRYPDVQPRYDLDNDHMNALTAQLLQEREPHSHDQFICYGVTHDSPYANVARSVEREVFERYFGNDSEQMHELYGAYEDQSIFFLSVDQESKQPVGVLRVIENGPNGLKTLNDLEAMKDKPDEDLPKLSIQEIQGSHDITSLDECWDVGTVAVRKQYRGNDLRSVQLYRALYVSALENNIRHFVSIIDQRPFDKMVKFLGIPFVAIGGSAPFSYAGSDISQAAYGNVPEFYPKMNRKRFTLRGALARRALNPLVKGTMDQALHL